MTGPSEEHVQTNKHLFGWRRAAVLLALALAAGCSGQTDQCRSGFDCASGVCLSTGRCAAVVEDAGVSPDATVLDSGEGARDGAAPDAAAPDAETDGGTTPPYDSGTPGCTNHDLVIDRSEVSFVTGLRAKFRRATNTPVETAGRGDAGTSGGVELRTWDLSGPMANDSDEEVVVEPLAGKWFEATYPDATYASWLDGTHEVYGIFRATPDALLMLGMASPADDIFRTQLVYDPPVEVLVFPMAAGDRWETTAAVSGEFNGLPIRSVRHVYTSSVDSAGLLQTPYGRFPVVRVNTQQLQQALVDAAWVTSTSVRTLAFVSPCFGTVATIRSLERETNDEFTTAAEVRRLTP